MRPVLSALQRRDPNSLPFKSELVDGFRPTVNESDASSRGTAAPVYLEPDSQLEATSIFPGSAPMSVDSLVGLLKEPRGQRTTFDESQRHAIAAALQQRVAVIQGPPGTGKSFVGRELACLLLQLASPILVVTYNQRARVARQGTVWLTYEGGRFSHRYKNHALDEFLEGCIDRVGLDSIARLGSRSQSDGGHFH